LKLKSGPESGPDLYVGSELRFVAWSKTGLSWSQCPRFSMRPKHQLAAIASRSGLKAVSLEREQGLV
jgi:hypothetical protein